MMMNAQVKGQSIKEVVNPAAIVKPSVARPNGSRGGLEALLRSLSAASLTNLGSDAPPPQESSMLSAAVVAVTFNGLNVSAHSAFRPLQA